jgi:glutamine cyclotransferase
MPKTNSSQMKKACLSHLMLLALLAVLLYAAPISAEQVGTDSADTSTIPIFGYRIINTYPHDPSAFTQGLVYDDGVFYEGTGLYGQSTLRRVDLKTGQVLQQTNLSSEFFGEGIAIWKDRLIQLTWQSDMGFVYGKENLTRIGNFSYQTEGWGITSDGKRLIMSDGTDTLRFLDPVTFLKVRELKVTAKGMPVNGLNELEYINGEIYANMWPSNSIIIIAPDTGLVAGSINLKGILKESDIEGQKVDVLNGIAYDASEDRLFVTGKWWPKLFEIKLVAGDEET